MSPEEDALAVVIVDDSMPFDLGLAPERDLDLSLEDTALGGLGLYLVHQMMDSVDLSPRGGLQRRYADQEGAREGGQDADTDG